MKRLRKDSTKKDIGVKLESEVKGSRVKSLKEYHLLNLLVHSPETAGRVLKDDFKLLISDDEVIKIFDKLAEIYGLEKKLVPDLRGCRKALKEKCLVKLCFRSQYIKEIQPDRLLQSSKTEYRI